MLNEKKIRNRFFKAIRVLLLLSVLVHLGFILFVVLSGKASPGVDVQELLTEHMGFIFWALITFALSFGSDYIEKRERIDIPDILEVIIVIFIFCAVFLSARFNLYYRFFWWDDLLHTFSGLIIGFIGVLVIYRINRNYSMDISPFFVALFSFTFAVTLGVLWEIFEFSLDTFMGSAHQKWDLPETERIIGKPYQGSGLRDTMSDLIVDSIGALIASVTLFFMYRNRKEKILKEIEKMVSDEEKES